MVVARAQAAAAVGGENTHNFSQDVGFRTLVTYFRLSSSSGIWKKKLFSFLSENTTRHVDILRLGTRIPESSKRSSAITFSP